MYTVDAKKLWKEEQRESVMMVGKEEKKLLFIQTREKLFYLDLGIEVNSWDPISVISVKSLSRV